MSEAVLTANKLTSSCFDYAKKPHLLSQMKHINKHPVKSVDIQRGCTARTFEGHIGNAIVLTLINIASIAIQHLELRTIQFYPMNVNK
jgi:hypothetical protein